MTLQEYKILKEENPLKVFYAFWRDTKKLEYRELTYEEFAGFFATFITSYFGFPVTCPDGAVKMCTIESVQDKVFSYYNEKFGL